jgi:hypothetical protein
MESTSERKPYESPAVVYDAKMEVRACSPVTPVTSPLDLFDPANPK